MTLKLYYHPLASFCWKVLISLYENATPFEPHLLNLGDADESAAFKRLWPLGKMPVLRDEARDRTLGETSIIIEYLDTHYRGAAPLIPGDPDQALRTRLFDRVFDLHVQEPMQKIVLDRIRPAGQRDAFGIAQARTQLATSYALIETELAGRTWIASDAFTMADCAAAPALYYADLVAPVGDAYPQIAAYLARLKARPSFARVLEDAQPYFQFFPGENMS